MDKYSNFSDLKHHEVEGWDYRIHLRLGSSGTAILVPHGGKIERGTMGVADAIAGLEHTFYCFEGLKPVLKQNRDLHLTSNHFDEPLALFAVAKANRVITLHGAKGQEMAIYAGGLDLTLRDQVLDALGRAGIVAHNDPSSTRQGTGPTNICNRGLSSKGLQLELTFGFRKKLYRKPDENGIKHPTALFESFVNAIRSVLESS